MTVVFFLMLWLACIGLSCWADLSAQKHIEKGRDEAWK